MSGLYRVIFGDIQILFILVSIWLPNLQIQSDCVFFFLKLVGIALKSQNDKRVRTLESQSGHFTKRGLLTHWCTPDYRAALLTLSESILSGSQREREQWGVTKQPTTSSGKPFSSSALNYSARTCGLSRLIGVWSETVAKTGACFYLVTTALQYVGNSNAMQ